MVRCVVNNPKHDGLSAYTFDGTVVKMEAKRPRIG